VRLLRANPEAQRVDRRQVLGRGQLAGRVRGQRQLQLLFGDAAAVVGDADQLDPALFNNDVDPRRPRVDAVLDQLFHHRRRPLDHLARGDLVHKVGFEAGDGHGAGVFRGGVTCGRIVQFSGSLGSLR